MPNRVEKDPKRGPRLMLRFRCTQLDHFGFAFVEIEDHQVQMYLLRRFLARPIRSAIVVDLLEGDAVFAVVRPDLRPAVLDSGIPAEDFTIESGQDTDIRAVDDETREACNWRGGILPRTPDVEVKPFTSRPRGSRLLMTCRVHPAGGLSSRCGSGQRSQAPTRPEEAHFDLRVG